MQKVVMLQEKRLIFIKTGGAEVMTEIQMRLKC